ncbi:putative glucan 1,3-beta-glucosidase D [Grifola frondosa]|uniref:glucan 1,3-beta-glucosidase n=1 Tax=Grifola frondosa TaxID=5627 RepID=A0A1C7M4X1_GRIFR|nr:putative glucan 1,3-beta-glucosidase D [Grifola frondosa]
MSMLPAARSSTSDDASSRAVDIDLDDTGIFIPAEPSFFSTLSPSVPNTSADDRSQIPLEDSEKVEQPASSPFADNPGKPTRRRLAVMLLGGTIALIVVVLAVILPVYFIIIKKHATGGQSASSGSASNTASPTAAITGGDGSVITTADGVTFTYSNSFGGSWIDDPTDPYNNGAHAQSWTPALNETWDYSTDQIHGVNLGGWLVLEPFIVPALFEKYQNSTPSPALPGGAVVDEWSLSVAMLNDTSEGGGIQQIEEHYKTFITEQDFAQMVGAGINWIRLPVPYWAIETWPGEPFLERTAWTYVLLALKWARKYGLPATSVPSTS